MGEWLLSRRDRLIVARHEVPYLVSVVSSAPIEHSAYFDLTSLQKCE